MSAIASSPPLGFGGYLLPEGQSFSQMQTSVKVQKIFFAIFFSALVAISVLIIPVSFPIGLIATALSSYLAIRSILAAVGAFYRGRPTQNLFPNEVEAVLPPLGTLSDKLCSGFATRDGIESHEWKLNLIRAAKHTIFLSGCYCGGKAFDQALDLIQERMRLLPALKASILCSDIYITSENRKRIKELEREFIDRFSAVITPEVFPYLSPVTDTVSLSTQHTKALVIDHGAVFMVGGSGMVSSWSEQRGEAEPIQVENHGILVDHILSMKAYRDMDFVFQSPELNGPGTRLYVEMTKLFERFRYDEPKPPFTGWPARVEPIEIPRPFNNLKLACYTSGPEQTDTMFLDEVIEQVNKAERRILIGHMYFHPSEKFLQALINASNRGVQITLLTNQLGSRSPGSHACYAELSRYNAKLLFEGIEKPNIEYYEYSIPYTTYHKKVIVIDDTTLLGSSNIGQKSLESRDYEINFKVESADFANSIGELLEADKQYCVKDSTPHISLKTRIYSTIQSFFVPFL